VAVALQAARHHDAIGPSLEGVQDLEHVDPAGAGELDDMGLGRILQAEDAGKVGGGVSAIPAAVRHDVQGEAFRGAYPSPPSKTPAVSGSRSARTCRSI